SRTSVANTSSLSSSSPTFSRFKLKTSTFAMGRTSSALDLDVDTGGEVQLHQRVERLRRRLQDVDQTLVGAHLELLARLLVDVRSAQHGVAPDPGGERDRTRDARARAASRLYDVRRRFVEELMIERLQANSNLGRVSHCRIRKSMRRAAVTR